MPHTLGAPMKCCVVAIGIDRYRASLALRFCLWYPATALARLADPDPIDGLRMAPAELFSEHWPRGRCFFGDQGLSEGCSALPMIWIGPCAPCARVELYAAAAVSCAVSHFSTLGIE